MKNLMFIPLIILLSVVSLYGQQVENASEFKTPGVGYDMSGAEEQAAFLDWSRVRMDHSVSMSMGGSALGSQSYLTYRNQIYMPLTSNLSFYGNLYWELQTSASSPALERLNSPAGDIYFDANLVYRIGKNSSLSIGISRYPGYYSPYGMGYYNPSGVGLFRMSGYPFREGSIR